MNTHQQGISMLEILITIVVISFGFLSLASFQMGTLSHLSGTNQHFLATTLANNIGESMRANTLNADDYAKKTETFDKDCEDEDTTCTVAERDFYLWKAELENNGLQDAKGEIVVNGDIAIVTITWQEKASKASDEKQTYALQVPL